MHASADYCEHSYVCRKLKKFIYKKCIPPPRRLLLARNNGQPRDKLGRAKRIWYLSPMRAAKVQASLRIRAVSPEPSLLAHTSSESRGTFRQKAKSLAPLNGWACAVKIGHDGMLEDTNSLDGAQLILCRSNSPTLYIIAMLLANLGIGYCAKQ